MRLGESGPRLNQNLQLIIETCGTAGSRVQPQGGISSFITVPGARDTQIDKIVHFKVQ